MNGTIFRPKDRPWLNFSLFGLTAVSVVCTWAYSPVSFGGARGDLAGGLMFGLTLILILTSHEMGHYVLARIHGVDTSLPYFIPVPLVTGTFGAVIRIRSQIPNRNALVDIGAAGPLAGVIMMIPLMIWGYAHSPIIDLPVPAPGFWPGPNSILAMIRDRHSDAPAAISFFGDSALTLLIKRFTIGVLPAGKDIQEHPVAIAAWFGMLITMLNLLPIGQLDGGHMMYAVFGERAKTVGKCIAAVLVVLAVMVHASWAVWFFFAAVVVGFRHPPVTVPDIPLTRSRKIISALSLLALILCVMPMPLTQVPVR